MAQSKKTSLLEACANVGLGYIIAVGTQMVVYPLYGMQVTLGNQLEIGVIFMFVSIARSYGVRRFFDWRGRK
jgi:hypothetical protein